MCVELVQQQFSKMNISASGSNKKVSYSIKKLLKQLFNKFKTQNVTPQLNIEIVKKTEFFETLEFMENCMNKNIELDCPPVELQENNINDGLSTKQSCEMEDFDFSELNDAVPVHFIRSEHGTFFWTATTDIPADNDLPEPMSCSTYNQLACMQYRWPQN